MDKDKIIIVNFENVNNNLCVICDKPTIIGKMTCCDICHEKFVEFCERQYGISKKVTDQTTGISYKVPTRDIIEIGLKWENLTKYPRWKETDTIQKLIKKRLKMDNDEIIKDYIKYLRNIAILDDEDLIKIMNKWVDASPEHIDILKKILYDKENIKLTTLTFAQSAKFKEEFDVKPTGNEINIYVENVCLSADELKKLTQCIREIEQNNTERLIKIWMDTPEKTVEEMEDVLNSVKPGFPHKMVLKGPKLSKEDDWTKF